MPFGSEVTENLIFWTLIVSSVLLGMHVIYEHGHIHFLILCSTIFTEYRMNCVPV